MKVLGIIPARGGSKGVPRKNIRELAGKPLLGYTADAALGAKTLTRVIVSTDDEEIRDVAISLGLDVPFLRPDALAQDDTPTLPVIQHVLRTLEGYDAMCLLQPTDPLRRAEDIDACVSLLINSDADAVVSMLPVPAHHNPHWVYFQNQDGSLELATGGVDPIPRRQLLPPAFHRSGSVYVTRSEAVLAGSLYGNKVIGHPMDPARTVNIDTWEDWAEAERKVRELG